MDSTWTRDKARAQLGAALSVRNEQFVTYLHRDQWRRRPRPVPVPVLLDWDSWLRLGNVSFGLVAARVAPWGDSHALFVDIDK